MKSRQRPMTRPLVVHPLRERAAVVDAAAGWVEARRPRLGAQRHGRAQAAAVRPAFSLLEIIIATAILSASTVMLLGLLSTGERHARQAERRVLGQMLCQSLLDEVLAAPAVRRTVDREPVAGDPEWVYSLKETPTDIPGLSRLKVSATWIDPAREATPLDSTSERTTFELVRLVRLPVNAPGTDSVPESVATPPSSEAPLP